MKFGRQMKMLQRNIPAPLLGQTVETESSSERFVHIQQPTWHHIPEDCNLDIQSH